MTDAEQLIGKLVREKFMVQRIGWCPFCEHEITQEDRRVELISGKKKTVTRCKHCNRVVTVPIKDKCCICGKTPNGGKEGHRFFPHCDKNHCAVAAALRVKRAYAD